MGLLQTVRKTGKRNRITGCWPIQKFQRVVGKNRSRVNSHTCQYMANFRSVFLNIFDVMPITDVRGLYHETINNRLDTDTYIEFAVSARVIVPLCIEISCSNFIALLALRGHASAVRVILLLFVGP